MNFLRATKENGQSHWPFNGSTGRNMWLNLSELHDKDKLFLLDALFSLLTSLVTHTVVERFQEARKQVTVF